MQLSNLFFFLSSQLQSRRAADIPTMAARTFCRRQLHYLAAPSHTAHRMLLLGRCCPQDPHGLQLLQRYCAQDLHLDNLLRNDQGHHSKNIQENPGRSIKVEEYNPTHPRTPNIEKMLFR